MIDDLGPYPEYKSSGLPWLGSVPAHWRQERAKGLFIKVERPVRPEDETITCFRDGTVTLRKNRRLRGYTEAIFELGYQGIRKGDLVIHAMDAFAGAVGVSDSDGKGSPIYGVCRPKTDAICHYYAHIVREMSRSKWILALSRGIRERSTDFRYESFGRQFVPVPAADEQAAIVRFLDYANGKIERAIRAKRKLIALLNEQKQAIIYRAVTRGLDPNVQLKPSGIPWLGDVPENWEVIRLSHVISLLTGYPFPSAGFSTNESDIRLLRGVNVTPSGIRWDSVVRWKRRPDDGLDDFALQVGDIVLGMDRPIVGTGIRASTIRESDIPSMLLQRVARLRPKSRIDLHFLLLLLRGRIFADYMAPIFTGISVPHLSPEQIKVFKVMLPPIKEQEEIVKFIEYDTSTLDTAISRTEREIALLREYRTVLTAEVVTGKLDVRDAATRLPVEADDLPNELEGDDLVDDPIGDEDFEEAVA